MSEPGDDFGQNQEEEREFCPNLVGLRTKSRGEARVLSEPGETSDKIKRRSRSFVRTWYDFGQN